jgi:Zn finger protein HypA/HybF involved in hydrogenase expression
MRQIIVFNSERLAVCTKCGTHNLQVLMNEEENKLTLICPDCPAGLLSITITNDGTQLSWPIN